MDTKQYRELVEAQVGDKYRLGAEVVPDHWRWKDPSDTWDCSELVQGTYGAAGVKITDGAWLQYEATEPVAHGHERVGDLVFLRNNPDRPNGIGHVGIITRIYVRDGKVYDARIVEAKGTDYGVVFSMLSAWRARSSFAGARQLKAFHDKVKDPAPAPSGSAYPLRSHHYFGPNPRKGLPRAHDGRGDTNDRRHVVAIQKRLGVPETGVYGARTVDAVKAYQRRHDLDRDGLVGPKTWKAMKL